MTFCAHPAPRTLGGRCYQPPTVQLGTVAMCPGHAQRFARSLEKQLQRDAPLRGRLRQLLDRAEPKTTPTAAADELRSQMIELAQSLEPPQERVYFMESVEGLIKIGVSRDPLKRVREVNRGSSNIEGMRVGGIQLLGTMAGGRAQEKRLHRRFAHLRAAGEWFWANEELRAAVKELIEK